MGNLGEQERATHSTVMEPEEAVISSKVSRSCEEDEYNLPLYEYPSVPITTREQQEGRFRFISRMSVKPHHWQWRGGGRAWSFRRKGGDMTSTLGQLAAVCVRGPAVSRVVNSASTQARVVQGKIIWPLLWLGCKHGEQQG